MGKVPPQRTGRHSIRQWRWAVSDQTGNITNLPQAVKRNWQKFFAGLKSWYPWMLRYKSGSVRRKGGTTHGARPRVVMLEGLGGAGGIRLPKGASGRRGGRGKRLHLRIRIRRCRFPFHSLRCEVEYIPEEEREAEPDRPWSTAPLKWRNRKRRWGFRREKKHARGSNDWFRGLPL